MLIDPISRLLIVGESATEKKKRSNIRNNISEIIRRRLLGWGFKSSVEMPGDVVALSFSITYMGGIESEIDES